MSRSLLTVLSHSESESLLIRESADTAAPLGDVSKIPKSPASCWPDALFGAGQAGSGMTTGSVSGLGTSDWSTSEVGGVRLSAGSTSKSC